MLDLDTYYMQIALEQAKKSYDHGEIPVGAIVTLKNEIIGVGFNQKELQKNATRHAEIIAIEQACSHLGDWRLEDCTLYVTLEPCVMCTGAIIQSHLSRVVVGASANKQKGLFSLLEHFPKPSFNHYPSITTGICEEDAQIIIKQFFKSLRKGKNL